ncbi:transcription corepressor [Schizosaccharomyces japonicus yFS275]|uniref:Transcription corepressor n=1 Tax=Schizosaccharomyces japonicus (strain yFS275 / FY16936) TaxID=402676 RepID=B6K3B1_SCHJY|nr:transcription corepressor [Schizosaccharomyces japonicus yFS275]EEB07968.1 transcription corepressor [Schizosaccharomyces japonicus yFS275]
MSEGFTDDELSLPKATVQKLVSEMLPSDLMFTKETRDLLIECCVEFIHLVSSEANEICEKEAKKTIAAEHIIKALQNLEFKEYIDEIVGVAADHKEQQKNREKKTSKFEQSGVSRDELLRQQEELLSKARERFQNQNKNASASGQTA